MTPGRTPATSTPRSSKPGSCSSDRYHRETIPTGSRCRTRTTSPSTLDRYPVLNCSGHRGHRARGEQARGADSLTDTVTPFSPADSTRRCSQRVAAIAELQARLSRGKNSSRPRRRCDLDYRDPRTLLCRRGHHRCADRRGPRRSSSDLPDRPQRPKTLGRPTVRRSDPVQRPQLMTGHRRARGLPLPSRRRSRIPTTERATHRLVRADALFDRAEDPCSRLLQHPGPHRRPPHAPSSPTSWTVHVDARAAH